MKKAYLLVSSLVLSCCAFMAQAQVMVNGTNNYVNLSNAFAAINTGAHTGAIIIEINDNISEGTGTATLNASGVGPASYTSVVIRPTAPNLVDSGSNTAVVQLKGADNVTIDGDYVADVTTTRDLTFRNTSIGGSNTVIWITSNGVLDGALNNTIRNCNIEGVDYNETFYGILTGAHTLLGLPSAAAAKNNSIIGNSFSRTRDALAIAGGATIDENWTIENNIMGSQSSADRLGYQALSMTNTILSAIRNNEIFNVGSDVMQSVKGINLGGNVAGIEVSGNRIHELYNENDVDVYGAAGIYVNTSNTNSNIRIFNNEIWAISNYGTTTSWGPDANAYGIVLAQGGDFDIFYNTVYMNWDPEIPGSNSAALYIGQGVALNAIAGLKNNILYHNSTIYAGVAVYDSAAAAFAPNSIDHNLYYSAATNLNFIGGAFVPDLASWKALTTQDTGSVSGSLSFVDDGDRIYVDTTDANCWFVNGRSTALSTYGLDSRGLARSIQAGTPSDIGDREFTPAAGVLPPDAIADAAPANSTTTSYYSAGRKVAAITWGAAGTVPTSVSVKYYPGEIPPAIGANASIHSYWDISAPDGSGYDYELSLTFLSAENYQQPDGSLNIIRDSTMSGGWANSSGIVNALSADGRICELSIPLNSFTVFSLGSVPLGLELMEFTAHNTNGINKLQWRTADEKNMSHFEVLRSDDGATFSKIGKVNCRNEFMGSTYTFSDNTPKDGYNYYRLKMYELDGTFTYSNIVAVKNNAGSVMDITSVYPNPAFSDINVAVSSAIESSVKVEVTDLAGKTMIAQCYNLNAGNNEVKMNVSELPSGIYMIKAMLADGTTSVQKFVKQ